MQENLKVDELYQALKQLQAQLVSPTQHETFNHAVDLLQGVLVTMHCDMMDNFSARQFTVKPNPSSSSFSSTTSTPNPKPKPKPSRSHSHSHSAPSPSPQPDALQLALNNLNEADLMLDDDDDDACFHDAADAGGVQN